MLFLSTFFRHPDTDRLISENGEQQTEALGVGGNEQANRPLKLSTETGSEPAVLCSEEYNETNDSVQAEL